MGELVLPFGTGLHNSIIFMRALLCGILLLRLPLFVPLTVLGLREPKQVGALPGPGKADSQLAAFLFFLALEGSHRSEEERLYRGAGLCTLDFLDSRVNIHNGG